MPKPSSSFLASLLLCVSIPAISLNAAYASGTAIAQAEDHSTPGSWPTRSVQDRDSDAVNQPDSNGGNAESPRGRGRVQRPAPTRGNDEGAVQRETPKPQEERQAPQARPARFAAPDAETNAPDRPIEERPRRERRDISPKAEPVAPPEIKSAPVAPKAEAPQQRNIEERSPVERQRAEPKAEAPQTPETKSTPAEINGGGSETDRNTNETQRREHTRPLQNGDIPAQAPDSSVKQPMQKEPETRDNASAVPYAPKEPLPSEHSSSETIQPSAPAKPLPVGSSTAPAGEMPTAPKSAAAARPSEPVFAPGFRSAGPQANSINDVQRGRRQRTVGNETLIEEPGNRVIVRENDRTIIRSDETARFAGEGRRIRSDRRANGEVVTTISRDGAQVFNIVDVNGRTLRRYRRDRNGTEVNIIDNRDFYKGLAAGAVLGAGIGLITAPVQLPPPRLAIPRDEYVVDYDDASEDVVYETLNAPPVENLSRRYSLDEVRYSPRLRERTRRLDLNAVNFATGSWSITPAQFDSLERVAQAINKIIQKNPREVFLVEGHTDAIGSDIDNLSLSDRRAESVAKVLSDEFDVPPENLVTQGYGEQYLKIPTQNPERENRRVAIRRITPLIANR